MVPTRNRIFSRERFNLRNKHSFWYSGLARPSGIDIQPLSTGTGVAVSIKPKILRNQYKPALHVKTKNITSHFRKGARAVKIDADAIKPRNFFRSAALARYSQIRLSQRQPKKTIVKKRRQRGRKSRKPTTTTAATGTATAKK